ncbi:MAG: VWA domain-containing protein [Pyrinomonadaceae bacterium]|nr:VWA domain-containing protein [Pyrinomonadaceae bacterium]
MKLLTAFVMTIAMLVVGAFSQGNTSTRPRVSPTATPPTLGNDTNVNSTPTGPPVLIGGNNRPVPTPTPAAGDDEIIRVETNLVTMPVSVLDRDGRFISGLQQNDFKIFENGVEQKLDYFQSVEQPFTVILLIDVSPSTQFKIGEIQDAASAFVDQLRPSDRVMVISFDESVHVLTPATNNRYQLKNAIRQLEFGDGTSLYEAVNYVIDNQLRQIQGRKAVVLFSDGVDTTSSRANYASTLRESEEVDALFYTIRYDTSRDMNGGGWGNGRGGGNYPQPRRTGKVTFGDILGAILMGGSVNVGSGGGGRAGSSSKEYETGRTYLEALAQNSGGRKFEAQTLYNVESAFSGIAEELRRQYSLGYYPEAVGKAGDRKQIKIRVLRQNVVVRAKTSYIVGQTNRNVAGK